ncbi:DUF3010 family protein [Aliivibrio fischeri]|uniref:DUF3010 family protein n=3 Tax=Aliivibrio fischeri TaxID=668 RepID=Q5E072_ALIF1|nr:DUF3010 family protein [Aliivibrio fischeri]AAW87574.1 hypothetical protein VF_A0504 [Aliivibrio fischeri ES114]ACH63604.1 conserved hypothetical protein [Aliivibrio fischeri MJ11]KLU78262.1 hypothetical protein AB192_13940 [Aliivibrio fischeri]MBP3139134.1 DUF3010 family protein [Aliivibrio fischeri]MBP3154724.1 DUF3010 family protein [Aliivibrio fischeri]
MKVCGVELKGNEAIICLVNKSDGMIDLPDCRVAKFDIVEPSKTESIRDFQFKFKKLMQDYQVETVVIKERLMKGKFAGGAVGFKLEAAIQLIEDVEVEVLSAADQKASLKRAPEMIRVKEVGLKGYQQDAYETGYAFLNF